MPPKTRFDREAVLRAALEVAREQGLGAVTARAVAKALGASTAPVSAAFDGMPALVEALVQHLAERLRSLVDDTPAEDPLHGGALAFARFARDEPRLYEALFLVPHDVPPDWAGLRRSFSKGLVGVPRYASLSPRARDALAWRATLVAHGLGVEVWSGRLLRASDAALRRLIGELVEPVIVAYLDARR